MTMLATAPAPSQQQPRRRQIHQTLGWLGLLLALLAAIFCSSPSPSSMLLPGAQARLSPSPSLNNNNNQQQTQENEDDDAQSEEDAFYDQYRCVIGEEEGGRLFCKGRTFFLFFLVCLSLSPYSG
jgi:hypothetical protein